MFFRKIYIILFTLLLFTSCDKDGTVYTGPSEEVTQYIDNPIGSGDECCLKIDESDEFCDEICFLDFTSPITQNFYKFNKDDIIQDIYGSSNILTLDSFADEYLLGIPVTTIETEGNDIIYAVTEFDFNDNGVQDPGEPGDYEWFDENGDLIAETDNEFYEYYYGDLITQYNDEEVAKLGWQYEASLVLGVDYYLYDKKYWVHGWASVMPFSKGLTDYSFVYDGGDIDFDLGLVAGYKFDKSFGVFGEARYLRYWGIDSYEIKAGLNYTIV